MDYVIPVNGNLWNPDLCVSTTFITYVPKPVWISTDDALLYLAKNGIKVTRPTLFNFEKANKVKTLRHKGKKAVYFDKLSLQNLVDKTPKFKKLADEMRRKKLEEDL